MAGPSGVRTSTVQPAQPPTAHAMNSSSDTWQGTPKRRASAALAASIGVGPQEKISTSASSLGPKEASHASASSVTKPAKQPGKSLPLASRLGTPHSSSNGMQAIVPAGMPGRMIAEGRARKGKGTSDPMSTSGFHGARAGGAV